MDRVASLRSKRPTAGSLQNIRENLSDYLNFGKNYHPVHFPVGAISIVAGKNSWTKFSCDLPKSILSGSSTGSSPSGLKVSSTRGAIISYFGPSFAEFPPSLKLKRTV